jgi:hypothetical protein
LISFLFRILSFEVQVRQAEEAKDKLFAGGGAVERAEEG